MFVAADGAIMYCSTRQLHPFLPIWLGRRWPDMHTPGEDWWVGQEDLDTEQVHPSIQQQTPPAIYDACLLLAPTWAGTLTEMVAAAKLLVPE